MGVKALRKQEVIHSTATQQASVPGAAVVKWDKKGPAFVDFTSEGGVCTGVIFQTSSS